VILRALSFALAGAAFAQNSVIVGTIRDTRTKAPLPGVTVEANVVANGPVFAGTTITGADGGFRFDNLQPATYRLKCALPGYVSSDAVGSELVYIRDAAVTEHVTLELFPFARLAGTVLDEDGQPLPGVMVYTGNSLPATTNQDGRYTVEQLPPGSYRIAFRMPSEIRRKTLKRDPETGETFGYADTEYYPGTADLQAAVPVTVSGGLDLRGFDARLRRVRLVEIGGRAVERAGAEPLAGARVELLTGGSALHTFLSEAPLQETAAGDGSFRFDLIQPGSYTLLVYRGAGGKGLPYTQPVEVGKAGIQELKVAVPPFPTIAGSVLGPPNTEWAGQVMVNVRSAVPGVASPDFVVTSGKFTIDDLPPGRWMVQVESNAVARPDDRKLFVKAVNFGTQNAVADTLTVTESGNPPLEIQLSPEAGRVVGTVADANGLPRTHALILIFRATAKGIFGVAPATGSTKEDGSFAIDGLAPGSYRLVVASDARAAAMLNSNVLVEVKAGETAVVRITSPRP
jgi:protocatechuate 3,4-dioxygenase beta subunit